MKGNCEKMLRWLEADHDLRVQRGSKKAWLTKAIGLSGHNQMKGAIATLKFIIEGWEE